MSVKSIRNTEGYLLLDHRQGDSVPDEIMRSVGLPTGSGHGMFESATYTCRHCQALVVMNPDRSRPRAVCRHGNTVHVICDSCAAIMAVTGKCVTFNQLADEALERAVKQGDSQAPSIILPT